MSLWATERKLTYFSIVIVFLLIVIALPGYYFLYKPPTCSDGKQNQGEQGVDCSGPCKILCPALALDPVIHWQRVFPSSAGFYDAIAYIENPNLGSYARNVSYEFDVYDQNSVLIAARKGTVDIWANKKFPIFEAGISTGERKAAAVTFQFTNKPVWVINNLTFPLVTISNPILNKEDTMPRLNATLTNANTDFSPIQSLPLVAILYDTDGNAIGASRTVVDYLEKNKPQNIFFIWPVPFSTQVAQKEIIPLLKPIGSSQ